MSHPQERGFTLLEVLLALAITTGVMTMVYQTLAATLSAREAVRDLTDSTDSGGKVLSLIERDLRGLWHHNIKDNNILVGRNLDFGGVDADRIDMLCVTPAITSVEGLNRQQINPPLNEVGYWLKPHRRYGTDLYELYRREDPLIDEDILKGGRFQLVHSRITSFKIIYYEELGAEAEEILEWDTRQRGVLPRRIKIEFTIEPKRQSRNYGGSSELGDVESASRTYVRHFVFDQRYSTILDPQQTLITVFPPPPAEQGEGDPAGGAGGPAGGPNLADLAGAAGAEGGAEGLGFNPNQGARPPGGGRGQDGGGPPPGSPPPIPDNIFGTGQQPPQNISIGDLLQQFGGG